MENLWHIRRMWAYNLQSTHVIALPRLGETRGSSTNLIPIAPNGPPEGSTEPPGATPDLVSRPREACLRSSAVSRQASNIELQVSGPCCTCCRLLAAQQPRKPMWKRMRPASGQRFPTRWQRRQLDRPLCYCNAVVFRAKFILLLY